jgi:penicillin-binding protein 2
MHPDFERYKLFSRRATMIVGGQAFLFSVLGWRLFDLQVIEGKRYKTLAEENRISVRLIPPPRGVIVDRMGREIASNRQEFRAVIVGERITDAAETVDRLSDIIGFNAYERARLLRELKRRASFVPVAVRGSLTWEQVARIEVNSPDLPGVRIEQALSRHYPYGADAAHLLGYVAPVDESELTGDPLLQLPDFRIGKNGVERVYDLALRGEAGSRQVEINAHGRVIRELARQKSKPGKRVALTVDIELQKFTSQRFGDQSGAAVVVDVHSGAVLAMASTPAFNPEVFEHGISPKYWRDLQRNPKAPLTNKAVAGQYAPGSTFKVVVALAALEAGVIKPGTTFFCPGYKDLGNARFHCWRRGGHGVVNLHRGIKESCDVYFYEVASRVGIDKIAAMARKLGLASTLGFDVPGEKPGMIPDTAWKKKVFKQPWYPGETLVAGIGQGYVLATPLQLAVVAARIANGGIAIKPHVARDAIVEDEIKPRKPPHFPSLGISKKSLDLVRAGMIAVTNEPGGTAYWTRIPQKGMEMAGKTGTSQVRRITKAERATGVKRNADLPWRMRDHALFIAFAPIEAPRYAMAVVVEHGGGGSHTAAPIAKDVLTMAQKLTQPPPAPKGKPEAQIGVKKADAPKAETVNVRADRD